jgi:hypothetical protein
LDAVAIRPLDVIFKYLGSRDLVGWINPQGRVGVNFLAARPRAAALVRWAEAQDQYLESLNFNVKGWSDIGSSLLTQFVRPEDMHVLDRRIVAPLDWDYANLLFSTTQSLRYWLSPETLTVQLSNERSGRRLSRISAEDLFASSMLVSRLLRMGAGIPRRTDEWRIVDAVGPFGRVAARSRRAVSRLVSRFVRYRHPSRSAGHDVPQWLQDDHERSDAP